MIKMKEVLEMLKRLFKNYGVIILFYLFLVMCVFLLNAKCSKFDSVNIKDISYTSNN